jgi:MYXO-CTERM domain-containing protein
VVKEGTMTARTRATSRLRFHRLGRLCGFAIAVAVGTLAARSAGAATVVACVGDSITAAGWPVNLGRLLGPNYQSNNYGVGGTTLLKKGDSPYWNTPAFGQSHASGPAIVVIMLGTNDSKPQNWGPHKAEFVGDYEALIDTYSALPSHPKIFINLCPPAGEGAYGISGTIIENEVIPLIRQVAIAKGVGLIDVFSAFGGHNFDKTLYVADLVHPSAAGTQRIADTVYAALELAFDGGAANGAKDAGARDVVDANAVDATKDAIADDAAGNAPSVEAGGPGAGGPDAAVSPDAAPPLGQDAGASIQPDAAAAEGGGALAGDSASPALGNAPAAGGGGGSGCSISRLHPFGFGGGAPNSQPGAAPNDKPGGWLLLPVLAVLAFRRRRRALAYIGNWG